MWTYQNGFLEKDGQSLCVSPELKLVEGESYEENVHFKIKAVYVEPSSDIHCNRGGFEPIAIPIEPQEAVVYKSFATDFEKELEKLINIHSRENESNTPDFILAEYLYSCLCNYEATIRRRRAAHSGEPQSQIAMTGDFKKEDVLLNSNKNKTMQTNYVYLNSEPNLWTVGFYDPSGKWHPESDHDNREDAANRVHFLNGGE